MRKLLLFTAVLLLTACSENDLIEPVVSVADVRLDNNTLTLTVGETRSLTATVLPENATNQNVSWRSSNNNVATVDEDGVVTAISEGTATITVTTQDGGRVAECFVTVLLEDSGTVELPDFIFIDENLGDDIDFAILGLDGIGFFYQFQDANPNIPQRITIWDGNSNEVDMIIDFDDNGLRQCKLKQWRKIHTCA